MDAEASLLRAARRRARSGHDRRRAAERLALGAVIGAPLALGAVHLPVLLGLSAAGVVALSIRALVEERPLDVTGPALLFVITTLLALAGVWFGFDPPATAAQVARALGLTAILVVLQTRAAESPGARHRVLLAVAFAGLAVASIGIGHFLSRASSLFGLFAYETARPPLLSTLGNPNHAAGVLNVAALVCLGLAVASERWTLRIGWALGFLMAAGASLLSASRGGIAALGAAMVFFPLVGRRTRRTVARPSRADREEGRQRLWFGVLATFAALALAVFLHGEVWPVGREVDALASTDLEADGKVEIARGAIEAIGEHPWIGIGAGAFGTAHTRWLETPSSVTFSHVENELLEAMVDLGVPLGLLLIAGVLLGFANLLRRARTSWEEAGAAAAALALLLQGLVDFSLHFAGGFLLFALLATRPDPSPGRLRLRASRPVALAGSAVALVAVVVLGAFALPGIDAETKQLETGLADTSLSLDAFETRVSTFRARRPQDYLPCELLAAKALAAGEPARALPALACATERHPTSGRIHALTGDTLARLGRKEQALLEYRMAADREFPTADRVLARWPESEAILDAAPLAPGPAAAAADALERAQRPEDATAVAERAIALTWLYGSTGPVDVSRKDMAAVEHLASVLHRTYSNRARDRDALVLAARVRATHPDSPRGWILEAGSLARLHRVDEARSLYVDGIARLGGEPELVLAFANFELGQKRPEAALAALDEFSIDTPIWNLVRRHSLRASAFQALREEARARDELRLALRLRPDDKWLRLGLAEVYLSMDRIDEAAVELQPFAADPDAKRLDERLEQRRAELEAEKNGRKRLQLLGPDTR